MKWKMGKLGEYCEITSSKRIFYSDYVSSGVPFYRSKEIIQKHMQGTLEVRNTDSGANFIICLPIKKDENANT